MFDRLGLKNSFSLRFWALAIFIIFVFLVGGASRSDSVFLLVLRPAAALVCAAALIALPRGSFGRYRLLTRLACAAVLLPLIQLVPLPPILAQILPGHGLVSDIDKAAGIENWRTISLVPTATRNALFSLSVPLAVFLLGIQISRDEQRRILPVVLVLGLVSALVGLLQVIGTSSSSLYFHELTNDGSGIGLFSNRNHQASFLVCLFPILGAIAAMSKSGDQQSSTSTWIALAIAVGMIPFILITGSRSGTAIALLAMVAGVGTYAMTKGSAPSRTADRAGITGYLVAGTAAVAVVVLSVMFSRALSIQRLSAPGQFDDLRFTFWTPTITAAQKYFPFGSGLGTFAEVYQIDEAHALLSRAYVNNAHNDWLELYMTGGVFALAILGIAVAAWTVVSAKLWLRRDAVTIDGIFGRLGSSLLVLLATASVTDYPLRTPSLMALAVMAALWMCPPPRSAT